MTDALLLRIPHYLEMFGFGFDFDFDLVCIFYPLTFPFVLSWLSI